MLGIGKHFFQIYEISIKLLDLEEKNICDFMDNINLDSDSRIVLTPSRISF